MSRAVRTRVIVMIAATGLVPAALYPFAGGWTVVWAPVVLMVVGVVLLLSMVTGESAGAPVVDDQGRPEPVPDTSPRSARVRETWLLSADEDYSFVFSAEVCWRWTGDPDPRLRNPGRQAEQVIVVEASRLASQHQPRDRDLARHRLAAELGVAAPACGGLMEVWADEIALALPEEDEDRLRQFAEIRKERNKWEVERTVERTKRDYFAKDVFATPGSAVMWELVRNGADVTRTAGLVGTLSHLSEAGKGEDLADIRERLRGWEPDLASALDGIGSSGGGGGFGEGEGEGGGTLAGSRDRDRGADLIAMIDTVDDENARITFADRMVRVLDASPFAYLSPRIREHFSLPGGAGEGDGSEEGGQPSADPGGTGSVPSPNGTADTAAG